MGGRILTASWADGRVHIIVDPECISSVTCKNLLPVRLRCTDDAGPYAHLFAFVSACDVVLNNPGVPASPAQLQKVEYP